MFSLLQLPEELLLRIFSFLEHTNLLFATQVSAHCSRVAQDAELWRKLFMRDLDLLPFVQNTTLTLSKPPTNRRINTTITWKQFYHESYIKHRDKYKQQDPTHHPGFAESGMASSFLRNQRTKILYIGPKKSGKSTLFYHMKFGTSFKGIYYLRKYGTVVSIDLALAPKPKKVPLGSLNSTAGFLPDSHVIADILPADLEVHDVEDFEALRFKRSLPDGVIIVVDSTTLQDPATVYHLTSLLSGPHIGSESVPVLVLATRWGEARAMQAAGVARVLGMWEYPARPWRVQSCSAVSLLGVREALQWLHAEMKDRKSWES